MTQVMRNISHPNKHRADIQVLRGIAVLAVLLFHTRESVFTAGYLGVDVFFVISGFVVTPLINRIFFIENGIRARDSLSRLRSFYTRRFYRLAPALGVSLILSFIVVLLLGPVFYHFNFANQGLAALFLLGNLGAYRYSGGNYFAPNPNPLVHLWSLSAEEQIYLFLPIAIFILLFVTKRWRNFQLYPFVTLLGVFAYALDATLRTFPEFLQNYGVSDVPGLMFYSPIGRFWEFCIGSCTYFLWIRKKVGIGSKKYLNGSLIALLVSLLFLPINGYKFQSVLISFIAAAAIYFMAFENLPRLPQRIATWLGNRSYSIYLVHMPILYVAIYSPLFLNNRAIATSIAFVLSIIVGSVLYENVEERFKIKSVVPDSRPARARTLLISFVIIPTLLFAGMRNGANNHYWGHDPNPVKPVYSSTVDSSCYEALTPCVYSVANPKGEALLIGDSHAASLFQTFAESMALEGFSSFVWQKNGCQFITRKSISSKYADLLRYGETISGEKQTCFSHNESIVRWIKMHPKAMVFVSQRSTSIKPSAISESDYRRIVFSNLLYLKTLSASLTVIGPNPEFPDTSKFFTGGLLVWQKAYIPPKSFPSSSMIAQPVVDNAFYLASLPSKGIGYINSIVPFCKLEVCTRWHSSKWLWTDSDHLSVYGAERLKPYIRQQIALNVR
jgi:peptidoglycan/LPS O-acetylase OafA/YrhL